MKVIIKLAKKRDYRKECIRKSFDYLYCLLVLLRCLAQAVAKYVKSFAIGYVVLKVLGKIGELEQQPLGRKRGPGILLTDLRETDSLEV